MDKKIADRFKGLFAPTDKSVPISNHVKQMLNEWLKKQGKSRG